MVNKRTSLKTLGLLLLGVLLLAGCNISLTALTGSGNVVSQEYDFTDFDEISISHAFTTTITQGNTYSVVVRVDDNLVDELEVVQQGNRVAIGLTEGTIATRATMEADITLPSLTWLEASGASTVQLNDISSTADFKAEASGASRIHGDVNAGDLDLVASGASTISLAGTGDDLLANASGASRIDLEEMNVTDANVTASGASNVTVNASGRLDANASGASNVHYLGNPELGNIDESGGSNVQEQ